jgi:hypothetical protein
MMKGHHLGSASPKPLPQPISTPLDDSIQLPDSECDQLDTCLLIVPAEITHNDERTKSRALIDCGAALSLIDIGLVQQLRIPLIPKEVPCVIQAYDGRSNNDSTVTHMTPPILVQIGQFRGEIVFNVTKMSGWRIIIGMPTLREHGMAIFCGKQGVLLCPRWVCQSDSQQSVDVDALIERAIFLNNTRSAKELTVGEPVASPACLPDVSFLCAIPEHDG